MQISCYSWAKQQCRTVNAYNCWKNWPPTQTLIKRTVKCILQQEGTEQRKMQQGWGMKEPMANSVADELPGNLLTLETLIMLKTSIWHCLFTQCRKQQKGTK